MIASFTESILQWCIKVANSDLFTFICGLVTIIGFIMTIYISVKTKSIHKKMVEYKAVNSFNKDRKNYLKTFKGYQNALIQDNADIYKTRINMLNDVNTIRETYIEILGWKHRLLLWHLGKELEKNKKIDLNKVCNLISKVIAMLSIKKEENYG